MRTARDMGLVGCTRCMRVAPLGTALCPRCGSILHSRDPMALQKVWAWWLLGLGCYIPANLYPMLETRTLVSTQSDTIVGGAVTLAQHGNWGVALIILVASVVIPVAKFLVLAGLAFGVWPVTGAATSALRDCGIYRPLVHDRRLRCGYSVVSGAIAGLGHDHAGARQPVFRPFGDFHHAFSPEF